ncbi:MAG: hypothetical protein O9284_16115 [Steroidobacteraceae bacterium]|nr:hypothetical protein [Steroidobacteraceae bacterium]
MEPLATGTFVATPWGFDPAWFAPIAVVVPALAWVACAWWRALAQDPNRMRRAGLRELRRLAARARRSPGGPQPGHLHAFLRAAARTWNLRSSAPTAAEVARAQLALTGDAALVARWQELWTVTERALFGARATPPADWAERVAAAAASVPVPKRERWVPNRLGDWLPAAASAVLVAIALLPAWATAQRADTADPAALRAIEQAGATALAQDWNDPGAHHHVAVARLARQDWNVALAHALAAFAQAPSAATRATLRAALEQNEPAARRLQPLLEGPWYRRAPALLSPAAWQRLALVVAVLLALLLATLVVARYAQGTAWRAAVARYRPGAVAAGGVAACALAFGAAVASWHAWGPLAQPRAAVMLQAANLAPIPTDLVPEAETSPVLAGTVVLVQSAFLGWQQVETPAGTRGWVRRPLVRPLYSTRS